MASILSLTLTLSSSSSSSSDSHHQPPPPQQPHPLSTLSLQHPKPHSLSLHNPHRFTLKSASSHSPTTTTTTTTTTTSLATTYSTLEESFKTGNFLSNEEVEKLKTLQDFTYFCELKDGSGLCVRVMRRYEMDKTVNLLSESFAESMLMPAGYLSLLRFLVKQYLVERGQFLPYAVTLIASFKDKDRAEIEREDDETEETEEEEETEEVVGTVEICFDRRGFNADPPTPTPPKNSPYICNMAVAKPLRRRGIGWNLLKASEELISRICNTQEVYLHCRMIDTAPFNMYLKAGYNIVKTDTILVLLMLQRRKHLMFKKLPALDNPSELSVSGFDSELSSSFDMHSS